jgi:uncharacterized membrane protein YeaQ/YmgE (transglycosylase-associated protein family)
VGEVKGAVAKDPAAGAQEIAYCCDALEIGQAGSDRGNALTIADRAAKVGNVLEAAREGVEMLHWLWVIIIGFLAGAIAKWFVAGPGGFIVTTLLGIIGAIFASWLGQRIGWYAPGQNAGFIGAIVGAVLILVIYRAIVGGSG